jgi:hypothetical protein
VSPINQKILILGWRRGAVFLSRDGGETFSTQSEVPPFHSDIHAIVFDPFDHNNKRLYIASDGGVVRVDGLAQDVGSANSLFNSHLPILQFDSRPGRMFFASFGGPVNGEFLGGGTQDTCMLYAPVRPQVAPWRPLQGRTATGDGHDLIGIEKLGAVYTYNTGPKPRLAWWDSTTQKFIYIEREIPITSGREIYWSLNRDPKEALVDAMMVALETPFTAPASARRIIALAVRDQVIFGLSIGAGGADPGWEALFGPVIVDATKMVNQQPNVSAMHSLNGSPILLGYVGGAVVQWSYSRPTVDRTRQYALPAALLKKPNATSDDPVITHVAAVNQQLAYAVLKSSNGSTTLFKLVGDSGVQTLATGRNDTVYSLTVVPMRQSVALFVAYDDKVLVSENEGGTWRDASNGLPKCPHSSTLCYLPNTAGDGDLYLSTYGRSVWKTQLLR